LRRRAGLRRRRPRLGTGALICWPPPLDVLHGSCLRLVDELVALVKSYEVVHGLVHLWIWESGDNCHPAAPTGPVNCCWREISSRRSEDMQMPMVLMASHQARQEVSALEDGEFTH
jgi:hypothetical protein